jgi:hypothetical protein
VIAATSRRAWSGLVVALMLALMLAATPAAIAQATPDADAAALRSTARQQGTVRVIVDLRTPTPVGALSAAASPVARARIATLQDRLLADLPASAAIARRFVTVPRLALSVDEAGLDRLLTDPNVAAVRVDRLARPFLAESLPLIGADEARADGLDGSGWAVAVLDTGVQTDHPFLAGAALQEACFSTTGDEATSACPDGSDEQIGPGAAAPPAVDGGDHGTHVAGIAVGGGDGRLGVAPGAGLIAVQVFSIFDATTCGGSPCLLAYNSDILAGLEFVLLESQARDVAAVNLSLGGGRYTSSCGTDPIVTGLTDAGVAVVAAAGNESYDDAISWPACLEDVVAVGATGDGSSGWTVDQVAGFSNASPDLDLLAPGVAITSSVPTDAYAILGGTSMAAPHVAGAWALARQADATADVATVLSELRTNGRPVLDTRNGTNYPRLDLTYLVEGAAAAPDLAYQGPATLDPAAPVAGEALRVCVAWSNAGDAPAETTSGDPFVALRGWLDDPADPGARFTPDATVASGLAPGAGGDACYQVSAAIPAGPHVVHLALDPDGAIDERFETDNAATLSFDAVERPANDAFADRTLLTGASGDVTADTRLATRETDEPVHAGESGGASLWWTWTAPQAGVATFDTFGSGFDTLLALYAGDALDALIPLSANDDASGGRQSRASIAVEAGDVLQIAVDGYAGDRGDVTLAWSTAPLACDVTASDLRPLGDVDGNGTVDEADGLRILRYARGSWTPPIAGTIAFHHADLDGDGGLSDADARLALRKAIDPIAPAALVVHPRTLTLAPGEVACLWVGNAGSVALPTLDVSVDAGLIVQEVTPAGATGRAFAVARSGPGLARVVVDAGTAGRIEVGVDAP